LGKHISGKKGHRSAVSNGSVDEGFTGCGRYVRALSPGPNRFGRASDSANHSYDSAPSGCHPAASRRSLVTFFNSPVIGSWPAKAPEIASATQASPRRSLRLRRHKPSRYAISLRGASLRMTACVRWGVKTSGWCAQPRKDEKVTGSRDEKESGYGFNREWLLEPGILQI